jgi:N-acetylglutamate synthase-like GNAT family acetyltransferase
MSSNIRAARETDIAALVVLVNSAYRGESSKQGWTTEADILDGQRIDSQMLQEMIQDPKACLLILENLGERSSSLVEDMQKIEACVYLKKADSNSAYLGLLTVNPKIQNKGHGRTLLDSAEKWVLQNWNLQQIIMTVINTRHELIAWYERRGYVSSGKTSDFPMHDPRYGLPLVEKIVFTELIKKIG